MKLGEKIEKWFLLLFFFGTGLLFVEGNLQNSQQTNAIRNPVYFPALPDLSDEEFGLSSHGRSGGDFSPKFQPPVNRVSHRPPNREFSKTTGTLPLAKKSHVVDNSVTEAPGPSYLTESAYYHEGGHVHTTPAPRFEGTRSDHSASDDRKIESFDVESKRTFLPQTQEKNKRITILNENPAYLYYIPTNLEILSPESPPPKPIDSIVVEPNPKSPTKQPISTNILSLFHDVKTTHKPVSTISQLPSSIPTNSNFKPANAVSAQNTHHLSPIPLPKPASVSPSRGYLPKPARNPFAPRFSKPIVTSETPPKLVHASFTPSLSDKTSILSSPETTTIASLSLNGGHLEKQTQPPKKETSLLPSSGNKEKTNNHFLRHFGFNFNNDAANTIKQKRKAALIKVIPKEEEQKDPKRPASTDFFVVPSFFRV